MRTLVNNNVLEAFLLQFQYMWSYILEVEMRISPVPGSIDISSSSFTKDMLTTVLFTEINRPAPPGSTGTVRIHTVTLKGQYTINHSFILIEYSTRGIDTYYMLQSYTGAYLLTAYYGVLELTKHEFYNLVFIIEDIECAQNNIDKPHMRRFYDINKKLSKYTGVDSSKSLTDASLGLYYGIQTNQTISRE
jgi:hypothetical protein